MLRCALLLLALSTNSINLSTSSQFQNYFKYSGNLRECEEKCNGVKSQFFFGGNLSQNKNISSDFIKLNCSCREKFEVYFPKCCPPDYTYESKEHKCIQSNVTGIHEELNIFEVNLIKSGLEQCKIIVDKIIPKSEFLLDVEVTPDRVLRFQHENYLFENYCFDKVVDSDSLVLRLCRSDDFCTGENNVRCIKKCCPDGHVFIGNRCIPEYNHGLDLDKHSDVISNASEPFAVYISDEFRKYIGYKSRFEFYLKTNGSFILNERGTMKEYLFKDTIYCLEYYNVHNEATFFLLYSTEANHKKFQFLKPAMIISCISLGITLLGYCFLRDLHNLIGKIVINYCIAFLVACIALVVTQFNPEMTNLCFHAGVLIMFAFLATFTWMNVMCYDIWCTLGSVKLRGGSGQGSEYKKLAWYSLYAWSIPVLIMLLTILDHQYWILPAYLHPYIGDQRCLIEDRRKDGNYGYLFYFIVPCGILIFINLILFLKTVRYCLQVKAEINRMKDQAFGEKKKKREFLKIQKESISLIIKLFLVMGVPWVHETISSAYPLEGNKFLEVLGIALDTFTSLQGFFVFCIFMLKRKILHSVALKLGFTEVTRQRSASSTMVSNLSSRRHTIQYSRQNSQGSNSLCNVKLMENKPNRSRLNSVHESMEKQ